MLDISTYIINSGFHKWDVVISLSDSADKALEDDFADIRYNDITSLLETLGEAVLNRINKDIIICDKKNEIFITFSVEKIAKRDCRITIKSIVSRSNAFSIDGRGKIKRL